MIIRIQILLNELLLRVIKRMIFNEIVRGNEGAVKLEELRIRREQVEGDLEKLIKKRRSYVRKAK